MSMALHPVTTFRRAPTGYVVAFDWVWRQMTTGISPETQRDLEGYAELVGYALLLHHADGRTLIADEGNYAALSVTDTQWQIVATVDAREAADDECTEMTQIDD